MRTSQNICLAAAQRVARHAGRRAFTLTELLVVITIIAILASLITAGAINAWNASKRGAITTEIGQLSDAMERFKNEIGGAYPPNAMNALSNSDRNYKGDFIQPLVVNDFSRSFRKAFPRHQEPEYLLAALAGSLDTNANILDNTVQGGMNAAEAIYFWLGGFSADTVYPISGAGGPGFADAVDRTSTPDLTDEILENRQPMYEFELEQLGPRNSDGMFDASTGRYIVYQVNINGRAERRRINLWTYRPSGNEGSFAYFDASRHDPVDYDMDLSGVAERGIFAVKKVRENLGSSTTPAPKDIHFVNKGKYQILHPGLDAEWGNLTGFSITNATGDVQGGNASAVIVFPAGPFTGEVADTLTNFTQGTLENAQE